MRKRLNTLLACGLVASALATAETPDGAALRDFAALPSYFEPNLGGAHRSAQFAGRTAAAPVYLENGRAAFGAGAERRVELVFDGANTHPQPEALDRMAGVSYYAARGETKAAPVPHYGRIRYRELYPGIDIVYYFQGARLEYDLLLQPHADPSRIRIRYKNADALSVTPQGHLKLRTTQGDLEQLPPRVHQNGRDIPARYVLEQGTARFEIGAYDNDQPLTIDPVIDLATGFGGSKRQEIHDIAVDAAGAVYITGTTQPENFPATYSMVTNGLAPITESGSWAFIAKLAPQSPGGPLQLVYSTVLGFHGEGADARHIGVDQFGAAYVSGYFGTNPWTYNHEAPACATRDKHVFVSKFRVMKVPPGVDYLHIDYNMSPMNCNAEHQLEDMAVSVGGAVYLAGWTNDSDFLLEKALPNIPTGTNGFIVQVLPTNWNDPAQNLAKIGFSTLYGGSHSDMIKGIALGPGGDMFVTGKTLSPDLPVAQAYQPALYSPFTDAAFLARLRQPQPDSGQTWRPVSLVYGTYFSGNRRTSGEAVAVDAQGKAYIAGRVDFTDYAHLVTFPTVRGLQIPAEEEAHGFLAMFPPPASGQNLAPGFSTRLDLNEPRHVALDPYGSVYVSGRAVWGDLEQINPMTLPPGLVGTHFLARYWQPSPGADLEAEYVSWVPMGQAYAIAWGAGRLWLGGTGAPLSPLVNHTPAPNKTAYLMRVNDRVQVTIASNYPGRQVSVSGTGCGMAGWRTTPVVLPATPGAQCTLTFQQTETTTDTKYLFTGWSDGEGQMSRTITIGATNAVFTGQFQRQFRLNSRVQPSNAGTITPSGISWQNEGITVQHAASPAACYLQSGWSAGTVNGATYMAAPMEAVAYFVPNVANTTSAVSVQQGALTVVDGMVRRQITIRNTAGSPFYNVALVFDNLSPQATLMKASGVTQCALPAGSPYLNFGTLMPGEVHTVTLTFAIAPRASTQISYTNRVLHGLKPR